MNAPSTYEATSESTAVLAAVPKPRIRIVTPAAEMAPAAICTAGATF